MKDARFAPLSLFAAAACALAGSAAYGQAMEVVTVEAVREIVVGKSPIGAPIKELSIRSRVTYADLDLTTADGAAALEKRIRDTAISTCKEIKVQLPAEGSTEEKCVREAVEGAMPQVTAAIEAARKAK